MKKLLKFVSLIIICLNYPVIAQQKYAILLTGPYTNDSTLNLPDSCKWNSGISSDNPIGWDEFWNDTYLMWEMLVYEKGFTNENVFVLFADGVDLQNIANVTVGERYNPQLRHFIHHITDYAATYFNLIAVMEGLATGTNGFPQVTEKDMLFVWTFDHGYSIANQSYIKLVGEPDISDAKFAYYMKNINAGKKVFWMQQCYGGGFADDLQDSNTFFHSACQANQVASQADNDWDIENEKYPQMLDSLTCHHGEFNFHNYCAMMGESPYFRSYYGNPPYPPEPYSNADLNSDGIVSFHESYLWELNHETIEDETPLISDIGSIGAYSSLDYPNILHGDVFLPVLSFNGKVYVTKDVTVKRGSKIVLMPNSELIFKGNHKVVIDSGGILQIMDNCKIKPLSSNNIIEVFGVINFGINIEILPFQNSSFNGIVLNNCEIKNCFNKIVFNKCNVVGNCTNAEFSECTFNSAGIGLKVNNINHFYPDNKSQISILNCDFIGTFATIPAITIESFANFNISDCFISNYPYDGIAIFNSGYGFYKGNYISDCIIKYNGNNSSGAGIFLFNSAANIHNNFQIANNIYGIKLLNNSKVSIKGNPFANTVNQTQNINANYVNQILASVNSFPYELKWNAIFHGNSNQYLIYCNLADDKILNISNNYFGENFIPQNCLYPYQNFNYTPLWQLQTGYDTTEAEQVYYNSEKLINNGQLLEAKSELIYLIENYFQSEFAIAAVRQLFSIFVYNNEDLNALKYFLSNNPCIQNNIRLHKLAKFLISNIDIILKNYAPAVQYYEDIIENPDSEIDSICAIIDLEQLNLQISNAGKTAYGKLNQFVPNNYYEFIQHRNDLLNSIISSQKENKKPELKFTELDDEIKINVINNTIEIKFNPNYDFNISIFNIYGAKVMEKSFAKNNGGYMPIKFDISNFSKGIYFISLWNNNKCFFNKKFVIN